MKFTLQMVIEDETGQTHIEDIIQLEKKGAPGYCAGLSLLESKQLLKDLQRKIVLHQAQTYTNAHRACPCCKKRRRIKDTRTIQYRTVFGIVVIPSLRLYHCTCNAAPTKTFSV